MCPSKATLEGGGPQAQGAPPYLRRGPKAGFTLGLALGPFCGCVPAEHRVVDGSYLRGEYLFYYSKHVIFERTCRFSAVLLVRLPLNRPLRVSIGGLALVIAPK